MQRLLQEYWLPFTKDKGRRFPSNFDREFRSAMMKITYSNAESYQQCLLWKIFGYWTPQRSGRIADFSLGQTIFYDQANQVYYFKEAISSTYQARSSDRTTKGQKGLAIRENQPLVTARFPADLTVYFDFQLFVIRNVIKRSYSTKANSDLFSDQGFFLNRNRSSAKGETLNYWLSTVS